MITNNFLFPFSLADGELSEGKANVCLMHREQASHRVELDSSFQNKRAKTTSYPCLSYVTPITDEMLAKSLSLSFLEK